MNEQEDDVKLEEEEGVVVQIDEDKEEEESTGKVTKKAEPAESDDESDEDSNEGDSSDEGVTDEDREQIRARRRVERQKRKQVSRERNVAKDRLVASLQMQVQDLSDRLAHVDRRQSGTDFAKLEDELSRAVSTANEAQDYLKNAVEAGDGEGVAKANELYYTARRQAEHLAGIKQKITRHNPNQSVAKIDPRVVSQASDWMAKNKWYKHGGDDTDSMITKVVDDGLVKEGYDPRTQEYWDELNDRLSERLPHRFKQMTKMTTSKNEGGTPFISGGEKNSVAKSGNGTTTGKKEFFLSAARVEALKQAGDWDDPVRRKKMVEKYRTYDKQNSKK